MGFVQRAFTPPGTGGREAAAIQAQTDAAQAIEKANKQVAAPPTIPAVPAGPAAPTQFSPGQAPGAKQKAAITASSMLGVAATGGQTSKKTLLGA
jgi:hypothetical protein